MLESDKVALIVEADPFARQGLLAYLRDRGFAVHAAATVEDATAVLARQQMHLVVIDIAIASNSGSHLPMELLPGLRLIQLIKEAAPGTSVVIWSAHDSYATRAMIWLHSQEHYGLACVPKGAPQDAFQTALDQALLGAFFVSPHRHNNQPVSAAEALLTVLDPALIPVLERIIPYLDYLTAQEWAIARSLTLTRTTIGKKFTLSLRTVDHHIDTIYDKLRFKQSADGLEVFNRITLIVLAILFYDLRQLESRRTGHRPSLRKGTLSGKRP